MNQVSCCLLEGWHYEKEEDDYHLPDLKQEVQVQDLKDPNLQVGYKVETLNDPK